MERVASKEEARQAVGGARREMKTIALVPTMGALHAGHLSLVRAACKRADYVCVSIFVNPTQFGPGEDFESYPRNLERDLELLRAEGVDLVFVPSAEVMYALDAEVTVDPGPLAVRWEGAARPGHFTGVATVVVKLLAVMLPDVAYFGEKDYQQLRVIDRVVRDLDIPTLIVSCPTVRESDGLAMSSRNVRLGAEGRKAALALPEALDAAARALAWGETAAEALVDVMLSECTSREGVELDYAVVVDPITLEPVASVDRPARALVAATVDGVRLIDNAALLPCEPAGTSPEAGE